jgi:hypothetical protein
VTKEYLWEFLQKQGFLRSPVELYGEMELLWALLHGAGLSAGANSRNPLDNRARDIETLIWQLLCLKVNE